jgi:hypothetical protein
MGKKIISFDDGITLSNALGARLKIYENGGLYGLGTFYYGDTPAGGCATSFLYEDSHYAWGQYQATRYKVAENSEESGVIKFYGTIGVRNLESNWIVTVTLTSRSLGYYIYMQVEPYLWPGRHHPLYMAVSFDNTALECVSYPMEAPILPPYDSHWTVKPDIGKAPLLLGREKIEGKEIYVGVGYTLDSAQDYTQGALWYDASKKGLSLRADFPYSFYSIPAQNTWDQGALEQMGSRTWADLSDSIFAPNEISVKYFRHGEAYSAYFVVSVAGTQSDCVFGYRDMSGYSNETRMEHDIMAEVDNMLIAYKTNSRWLYENGKGYRIRGWADSDEKASYYSFLRLTHNNNLAVMLYKLWLQKPEERWARARAMEMVGFAIEKMLPSGAVPRAWDIDNDHAHAVGDTFHIEGTVYCPFTAGMSARYIDEVCDLMEAHEGDCPVGWREASRKMIDWVVHLVQKENGSPYHSYTADEVGVFNCIEAWPLKGLRYFYNKTSDTKYLAAMERHEDSLMARFGKNNDWYNGIDDSNNLIGPVGQVEQYRNYYTLNCFELADYFHDRYLDTSEGKYLRWSLDTYAFGWMGRMPVNVPGYAFQTKGVVEEQSIWPFYDLPWPNNSSGGLQRIARTVEDRFFAEYHKLAVHTYMQFVFLGEKHPFVAQALGAMRDQRGPLDSFTERLAGKKGVWVTGYNTQFLNDMTADSLYYYVGGRDWGVGLDYELNFNPVFGNKPYLRACSSRLFDAGWDEGVFRCRLEGRARENCELVLRCPQKLQPKNLRVNGETTAWNWHYDEKQGELALSYSQTDAPIELEFEV